MKAQKQTVLVVDDKRNMLSLMTKVLKKDARVKTAETGIQAIEILKNETVDAILCDLKMPDGDGLEVLKACKKLQPKAEFVLMTAYASIGTAVEALKLGAYDYLTKPFEPEQARTVLLQALSRASLPKAVTHKAAQLLPGIVAQSQVMHELADLVARIAGSDATALILGETGTGKERIARAVHELSPRSSRRFVAVNCAAIPAELLESELFGHTKGAFTGAGADRKGIFEEADGGSLFLDEIGDMRPSLQAKLTRVLEERSIRRIGESSERAIDVRLIAATHRDLESMIVHEDFREDLWYRLNVAQIKVPPLRERREDIKILAVFFLQQNAERSLSKSPVEFSAAALAALLSYDWPGNVRQLRSAVERACVVATDNEIAVTDLPPELLRERSGPMNDLTFENATWAEALEQGRTRTGKHYLEAILQNYDGQVSKAAAHAGVERESFYRLLRKYEVDPLMFRSSLS